jgi:hypothetical protein
LLSTSAPFTVQVNAALVAVAPEASLTAIVMPEYVWVGVPMVPLTSPALEMVMPLGTVPAKA